MKTIKLGIIIMLLAVTARAQEYTLKPNGNPSDITVVIKNLQADLEIVGYSGSEIRVESDDFDGELPEKAKGLKPLSAVGVDNTSLGLNIEQEGTIVTITGTGRRSNDATYEISIPVMMNLKADYTGWQGGDLFVKGLSGELEIKSSTSDIILEDVKGPLVLNTLSSDIEVVFSDISQKGPTSISSTSGDIDLTIPTSAKADFVLSTMSGEIYTNLDFDMGEDEKKGLPLVMGTATRAKTKLNGGGATFDVNAISGDVFIRKAK